MFSSLFSGMIFLLEPVLATIFSWIMLNETMTYMQILGAILIITSIAMASRSTVRQR